MLDISETKIEAHCPKCNAINEIKVKQVQNHEMIKCHDCGVKIELIDKNGSVDEAVKNVNDAAKNLEDSLKRLGRTTRLS